MFAGTVTVSCRTAPKAISRYWALLVQQELVKDAEAKARRFSSAVYTCIVEIGTQEVTERGAVMLVPGCIYHSIGVVPMRESTRTGTTGFERQESRISIWECQVS